MHSSKSQWQSYCAGLDSLPCKVKGLFCASQLAAVVPRWFFAPLHGVVAMDLPLTLEVTPWDDNDVLWGETFLSLHHVDAYS